MVYKLDSKGNRISSQPKDSQNGLIVTPKSLDSTESFSHSEPIVENFSHEDMNPKNWKPWQIVVVVLIILLAIGAGVWFYRRMMRGNSVPMQFGHSKTLRSPHRFGFKFY